MRRLLTVLFIVFSVSAFGQTYQYLNGPGVTGYSRGSLRVDSFFYLPNSLANSSIIRSGAVRYDPADSSLKVWTGTQWVSTSAVSAGSSNYIQNQYASKQTANAWFDSVKVSRVHVTDRITGALAGQSHIYVPFTAVNTASRANVGIHLHNRPLWDADDIAYAAYASPITAANGGSTLSTWRFFYEDLGDTNVIDYSPQISSYFRYTFDPVIKTYDSTTGKLFYPSTPGHGSTVQYFTQGNNIRLSTSQFGHTGSAYVGTLAIFDSVGTINTIGTTSNRSVPLSVYFSDLDLNRAARDDEKKVFRGQVGIANYFSSWKAHQAIGGAGVNIGNYVNKITGFQSGGSTHIGINKAQFGWAVNKAAILSYSTVDTSMGFWSQEQYNDSNEVKNGYGFVQSGVKDINSFLGKSYFGSWPLKADADTTTAKLVVKAKMWADSLAVGVISGNAYITGALSVGTNSTTYKAQIVNTAALGLKVTTTTPSTGNPGFAIRDNNTAQEAFFTPSNSNHLAIGNYTNHPIQFYQNNSSIATLNSTSLKVNSGRLNLTASTPPTSSADASGSTGDLIVGTDGNMYYKTATGWVKFAGVAF